MPVEHQDAAGWRWMLINGASLLPAADFERSFLLNNLHRRHPLTASHQNLPPPLSVDPRQLRQLASETN